MVPKYLHFYSQISLVNFHLVSDLHILSFIIKEICDVESTGPVLEDKTETVGTKKAGEEEEVTETV